MPPWGWLRQGLTTGFRPRHDEQGDSCDAEQHERVLGGGLAAVATMASAGEEQGVDADEHGGHGGHLGGGSGSAAPRGASGTDSYPGPKGPGVTRGR